MSAGNQVPRRRPTSASPRPGLADIVFDRLSRSIKSGAYSGDERLPTEHALAAEFQVSRPVVREALQRLRDQGLVYSRRGSGTYVRQTGLRAPLGFGELEDMRDLRHCYEFRITVEPEAAGAAAIRRSEDNLAEISDALDRMRRATAAMAHREDADFAFHSAIARASQNRYFATSLEALKDHIAVGMRFHGASVKTSRVGLEEVLSEHHAIYKAISDQDADAARHLMRKHLIGSRERVFEEE